MLPRSTQGTGPTGSRVSAPFGVLVIRRQRNDAVIQWDRSPRGVQVRSLFPTALLTLLCAGCPATDGSNPGDDAGPDGSRSDVPLTRDSNPNSDTGSARDSSMRNDVAATPDSRPQDAAPPADVGTIVSDGGAFHNGNPNGSCTSMSVPARGQPVDTSNPMTVVGTGTPTSCTFTALNAAVQRGGIITFNCGSAPVTIPITATINVPTDRNTVIDGGGLVTLDGQNAVQMLSFNSNNYRHNTNGLTLQHLAMINGKTNPTQLIPTRPAPCSQGYDDGPGGAVIVTDGSLVVIDCLFQNDQAAPLGPDTGGGAIYVEGSLQGVLIVGSTFENNSGSNAGAVGCLNSDLDVYNSLVTNNTATGNGANSDDATMCSYMNNGQNEVGSGGNGGALYMDGGDGNVTLCGDWITNNAAGQGAFGGGLFYTSDSMMGTLYIGDTTMTGNTGGSWTNVSTGSVTNVGSAIGVNALSITVVNSTLQGM